MPCEKKSDSPAQVKDVLPPKAQDVLQSAYNSAYDEYKDKGKRRRLPQSF